MKKLKDLVSVEEGQGIAEYAVMLAVIVVLVVATVRLVDSNANNVFSQIGSSSTTNFTVIETGAESAPPLTGTGIRQRAPLTGCRGLLPQALGAAK